MLHQRVAHQLVVGQVLHDAGAHHRVIHVDFRYQAGGKAVLQLQNLRLDAVAVHGYLHIRRDAQRLTRVLDDDGVPLIIPHTEYIVEVSVADFLGLHGIAVPGDIRGLFQRVLDHIAHAHQKVTVKT